MPALKALSLIQQRIIPIAAFTANGDQASLRKAIEDGLNEGLTINEVKEMQIHLYAYVGFPRALNGLATFMTLLDERKAKGIKDEKGKEPDPLPSNKSSVELGKAVQIELVGRPVAGPLFDFAPDINTFLQSHLFGDLFLRGVLDYPSRELATVSALASIEGVESQLKSHIMIAINVGLSEAQLMEVATLLGVIAGKQESIRVSQAIQQALHPETNNH